MLYLCAQHFHEIQSTEPHRLFVTVGLEKPSGSLDDEDSPSGEQCYLCKLPVNPSTAGQFAHEWKRPFNVKQLSMIPMTLLNNLNQYLIPF